MNCRTAAARLLVLLSLGACTGEAILVPVLDVDGSAHAPLEVAKGAVHVLVFLSQECPIANSYAPTLRELATRWREQPVRLFLVHVDPDLSSRAAREHRAAYDLPGTVLLDPEHLLAQRLGVQRTPEAVVLTADGLAYCGRIDDQWEALGSRRAAAHDTDLANAVITGLAGKFVPKPHPQAIGCRLPEPAKR